MAIFSKMPSREGDPVRRCEIAYSDCMADPSLATPAAREAACLESPTGWCACIGYTSACEMPKTLFQSIMQATLSTQQLAAGQFFPPTVGETAASGAITARIVHSGDPTSRFWTELKRSDSRRLQYAPSDSSRFMTPRLEEALLRIADTLRVQSDGAETIVVLKAFPLTPAAAAGLSPNSLHYEGRAAQVRPSGGTTLGELSSIAVASGLPSWVLHAPADSSQPAPYLHVSVRSGPSPSSATSNPDAPPPGYAQTMQEWYREFARHLLDGMIEFQEGAMECILGTSPSSLVKDFVVDEIQDASESLLKKLSRKMAKLGKTVLKVGRRSIPVARILSGLYNVSKLLLWFMADGSQYFTMIRDGWGASPRDYFKVGRGSGYMLGAAINAFDQELAFTLDGAQDRRRSATGADPLAVTWTPANITSHAHHQPRLLALSQTYLYTSTFTTTTTSTSPRTNSTDSSSSTTTTTTTTSLNCTLVLDTLPPVAVTAPLPTNPAHLAYFRVFRLRLDNASVSVKTTADHSPQHQPHPELHSTFFVVQHTNGTVVGLSAPVDEDVALIGLRQRIVHLLSINLGSGVQHECDYRGCHMIHTHTTVAANASLAIVTKFLAAAADQDQPSTLPESSTSHAPDIHSVVAEPLSGRATPARPKLLDADSHLSAVINLDTMTVDALETESYETSAFLPTHTDANTQPSTNASTNDLHSTQTLRTIAKHTSESAVWSIPSTPVFSSLPEVLAHLQTTLPSSQHHSLHQLHCTPLPSSHRDGTSHDRTAIPPTTVEALLSEALRPDTSAAQAQSLLRTLPQTPHTLQLLCASSHQRAFNALSRWGTPEAQQCLLRLLASPATARTTTAHLYVALLQLRPSPTPIPALVDFLLVESATSHLASQALGVVAAHLHAHNTTDAAARALAIIQHCTEQKNHALANGDAERAAMVTLMCLRHASHPAATAEIIPLLDHAHPELQKAAILSMDTAANSPDIEMLLGARLHNVSAANRAHLVKILHRRQERRSGRAAPLGPGSTPHHSKLDPFKHLHSSALQQALEYHLLDEPRTAAESNLESNLESDPDSKSLRSSPHTFSDMHSAGALASRLSASNASQPARARRVDLDVSLKDGRFTVTIGDYYQVGKTFGGADFYAELVAGAGFFTGFNRFGFFISLTGQADVNVVLWGFSYRLAELQMLYTNSRGGDLVAGHVTLTVANFVLVQKSFTNEHPDGDTLPADGGDDGDRRRRRRGWSAAPSSSLPPSEHSRARRLLDIPCFPLLDHPIADHEWDFGELTSPPILLWPAPPILATAFVGAGATFNMNFALRACLSDLKVIANTAPSFGISAYGGLSVSIAKVADVSLKVDVTIFDSEVRAEYSVQLHVKPSFFVKGCFNIVQTSRPFSGTVSVRLRILCAFGVCLYDGSKTIATWSSKALRKILVTTCPQATAADDVYDDNKQVTTDPPVQISSVSPLSALIDEQTEVTLLLAPETAPETVTEALCKFGDNVLAKARRVSRTEYRCFTPLLDDIQVVWIGLCIDDRSCTSYLEAQFLLTSAVASVAPLAFPARESKTLTVMVPGAPADGTADNFQCVFGSCSTCIAPATNLGDGTFTCDTDVDGEPGEVDFVFRLRLASGLVVSLGLRDVSTKPQRYDSNAAATAARLRPAGTLTTDRPAVIVVGSFPFVEATLPEADATSGSAPAKPATPAPAPVSPTSPYTPACKIGNHVVSASIISPTQLQCGALPALNITGLLPVSTALDGRTWSRSTLNFEVVDYIPLRVVTPANTAPSLLGRELVVEGDFVDHPDLVCAAGSWIAPAVRGNAHVVRCSGFGAHPAGDRNSSIPAFGTTQLVVGLPTRLQPAGSHPGDHLVVSVQDLTSVEPKAVQPWATGAGAAAAHVTVSGSGFPVNKTCMCMFGEMLVASAPVEAPGTLVRCAVPGQPVGSYDFQVSCGFSGWTPGGTLVYQPRSCPSACSGHGVCNEETGKCLCDGLWSSPDCSVQRCRGDCNGNGQCMAGGTCKCRAGYAGAGCSVQVQTTNVSPRHILAGNVVELQIQARVLGGQGSEVCVFASTTTSSYSRALPVPGSPALYRCTVTGMGGAESFHVLLALEDNIPQQFGTADGGILVHQWTLAAVHPLQVFIGGGQEVELIFAEAGLATAGSAAVSCQWGETVVPAVPRPGSDKALVCADGRGGLHQTQELFLRVDDAGSYEATGFTVEYVPRVCGCEPGFGECNIWTGECECADGRWGPRCELLRCPGDCGGFDEDHGICNGTTGACACKTGYTGSDCSELSMCSSSCPVLWTLDDVCDSGCIAAECNFDGDGCKAGRCPCPAYYIGDGFCDGDKCLSCVGEAADCTGEEESESGSDGDNDSDEGLSVDDEDDLEVLCAPGCLPEWLGNGACDAPCAGCAEEAGDCAGIDLVEGEEVVMDPDTGAASPEPDGDPSPSPSSPPLTCNAGLCPRAWLGDGECDGFCDTLDCGFDSGDCGGCDKHTLAQLGCDGEGAALCRQAGSGQALVMACECKRGWAGETCKEKVDLCLQESVDCGAGGSCVGLGECLCRPGYERAHGAGDGSDAGPCLDVDECAAGLDACSPFASCINTPGNYTCGPCQDGYVGDGWRCVFGGCSSPCPTHAYCVEGLDGGGVRCICEEDWSMASAGTGSMCVPEDKCARAAREDVELCPIHTACVPSRVNTSFSCEPESGYELDADTGEVRLRDLCGAASTNPCQPTARCIQSGPLVSCVCDTPGDRPNGTACLPLQAAACTADVCGEHGVCALRVQVSADGEMSERVVCSCEAGYEWSANDHACVDVLECDTTRADYPCDPTNAICAEVPGPGAHCTCVGNFVGNGSVCEPQFPCASATDCSPNAECRLAEGGCVCKEGWAGEHCDVDIDECAVARAGGGSLCSGHAVCVNELGGYRCDCPPTFFGSDCLQDVDECQLNSTLCGPADRTACLNTDGGYECFCRFGFVEQAGVCVWSDPCLEENACAANATCQSVENERGRLCRCKEGFEGDSYTFCEPVHMCAFAGRCPGSMEVCVETSEAPFFRCECGAGFERDASNSSRCVDKPSCVGPDVCGDGLVCVETPGSHVCICDGAGQGGLEGECSDVGACYKDGAFAEPACAEEGGECAGELGGVYKCQCRAPFWEGDGYTCTDVPECARGLDDCDPNADCLELVGKGWDCSCKAGFAGDGQTCADIDECALGLDDCDLTSTVCQNTEGSFVCACVSSTFYTRVSRTQCVPIDECTLGTDSCDRSISACVDVDLGWYCVCEAGWTPTPLRDGCMDIDECGDGTHKCSGSHIACRNTDGSHVCDCEAGWGRPAGQEDDPHALCSVCDSRVLCGDFGTCNSAAEDGGCQCDIGFVDGPGGACRHCDAAVRCGGHGACDDATGRCACEEGWTRRADCSLCDSLALCGVHGRCDGDTGGACSSCATCICDADYRGSRCELQCPTDEDGAVCGGADAGVCNAAAQCVCQSGFELDAASGVCVDVKECSSLTLNKCDAVTSTCVEERGSYLCSCRDGWVQGSDKFNCVDENECVTKRPCEQLCTNLAPPARYRCSCQAGYTGSTTCSDINECSSGAANCYPGAACSNTLGSYLCACPKGTEGSGYGGGGCSLCGASEYKDEVSGANCKTCPAGSSHAQLGATSISACRCDAGYGGALPTQCERCDYDEVKTAWGFAACSACPAHSETASRGSTRWSQCRCEEGYTGSITSASSTCSICPAGSYKDTVGSSSCTACPAQSTSPSGSRSANSCSCFAGYQKVGSTCSACPLNYYKAASGNSGCSKCSASRVTLGTGSDSESDCLCVEGRYWDGSSCQRCPADTYQDDKALTAACKACPFGMTTKFYTGRTSVSDCKCARYYYGPRCDKYCTDWSTCGGNGACNSNGDCVCTNHWSGTDCKTCGSSYCGSKCDMVCATCSLQSLMTFQLTVDGTDDIQVYSYGMQISHVAHGNPSGAYINGVSKSLTFFGSTAYLSTGIGLPSARNRVTFSSIFASGVRMTQASDSKWTAKKSYTYSCGFLGLGRCTRDGELVLTILSQPTSSNSYRFKFRLDASDYRGRIAFSMTMQACQVGV